MCILNIYIDDFIIFLKKCIRDKLFCQGFYSIENYIYDKWIINKKYIQCKDLKFLKGKIAVFDDCDYENVFGS